MSLVCAFDSGNYEFELDDYDQAIFDGGLMFNEEEVGVPMMFAPEGGFPEVKIGDLFQDSDNTSLEVVRKLGFGNDSSVWLVHTGKHYSALRMLSQYATNTFHSPLHDTSGIYDEFSKHSKTNFHPGIEHLVKPESTFLWTLPNTNKHQCLLLELAGPPVACVRQYFEDRLPPLNLIRNLCRQLLLALDFVHKECELVHTDITPDKILIVNPLSSYDIQDLISKTPQKWYTKPSTTFCDDLHIRDPDTPSTIFRSVQEMVSQPIPPPHGFHRQLEKTVFRLSGFTKVQRLANQTKDDISIPRMRAPEIVLGHQWNEKVDIWSFGCTIYEILTGKHLFKVRPDEIREISYDSEHLLLMNMVSRSDFPLHMIKRSTNAHRYFHIDGTPIVGRYAFEAHTDVLASNIAQARPSMTKVDLAAVTVFIRACLILDPDKRPGAAQLRADPFLYMFE
ncbi:kinase-like domain-containing protein [Collybia nuda]|uniref:non-specific serine/threonine protein kinase n=1 Tax=Collybia nuda TaxID=64659 RepID=A0A9P5YAF5_9AGAR|nr:kinase-like domain-containing protein [Collybia nuda]